MVNKYDVLVTLPSGRKVELEIKAKSSMDVRDLIKKEQGRAKVNIKRHK